MLEFFFFQRNLKGRYFSCIVQFSRCCSAFCFLAVQLFYYITSLTVCQVLFSSFLKNFFSTLDLRCLSSDSLSIISHLSELVKWFLKSFLFNFLRGYFHFPSRKSLQLSLTRFISSMRFLGFCCRSLTTVFIISHFLRLVNSNFTQFFRHFLCKITSIHHRLRKT